MWFPTRDDQSPTRPGCDEASHKEKRENSFRNQSPWSRKKKVSSSVAASYDPRTRLYGYTSCTHTDHPNQRAVPQLGGGGHFHLFPKGTARRPQRSEKPTKTRINASSSAPFWCRRANHKVGIKQISTSPHDPEPG
jgi:hypothetical protein